MARVAPLDKYSKTLNRQAELSCLQLQLPSKKVTFNLQSHRTSNSSLKHPFSSKNGSSTTRSPHRLFPRACVPSTSLPLHLSLSKQCLSGSASRSAKLPPSPLPDQTNTDASVANKKILPQPLLPHPDPRRRGRHDVGSGRAVPLRPRRDELWVHADRRGQGEARQGVAQDSVCGKGGLIAARGAITSRLLCPPSDIWTTVPYLSDWFGLGRARSCLAGRIGMTLAE